MPHPLILQGFGGVAPKVYFATTYIHSILQQPTFYLCKKQINQIFFDNELAIESKENNQGILDALSDLEIKADDKYYIAFDYVVDNQDIRNKYRMLKSIAEKSEGKIIILDMICFEYLILAFDKLVAWTGTGKADKIKIRDDILSAIEDHRINLSKIDDEKTLRK